MNIAKIFIKTYLREITILATAVVLVLVFSTLSFVESQTTLDNRIPKAVIIDQLHDDIPNLDFQQKATEYFKTAGYEVDLYTTKDITVGFYKELPSMNYEFIVARTHALAFGTIETSASLFTGEKYKLYKHTQEQLAYQVGKGVPYSFNVTKKIGSENLSNQTYFVIGYRFVDQLMVGEFPDSVIVLAGCDTMSNGLLSQSLIDRGASVVVGWDKTLLSTQNDSVTLAFLEKVLVNGEEVTEAVSSVMTEYKHYLDPVSLKYYPMDAT